MTALKFIPKLGKSERDIKNLRQEIEVRETSKVLHVHISHIQPFTIHVDDI